jgi:hypothetical protein
LETLPRQAARSRHGGRRLQCQMRHPDPSFRRKVACPIARSCRPIGGEIGYPRNGGKSFHRGVRFARRLKAPHDGVGAGLRCGSRARRCAAANGKTPAQKVIRNTCSMTTGSRR